MMWSFYHLPIWYYSSHVFFINTVSELPSCLLCHKLIQTVVLTLNTPSVKENRYICEACYVFLWDYCVIVYFWLSSILNQTFYSRLRNFLWQAHAHLWVHLWYCLCAALWFSLLLLPPPFCALLNGFFSFRSSLFFCFMMNLKTSLSIQNGYVSVEGGLLATSNLSSFVFLERKKGSKNILDLHFCSG